MTGRFASWAVVVALVVIAVCTAQGQDGDGGQSGAFMQVPIGARATAMGGAFRALADDGSAPLYNPAGPATIRKGLFSTSYRAMQLDRTLGYISVITPTQGNSALGASWLYANSGSVEARDTEGKLAGHDISTNQHAIGILFAKRFERWISIGANFRYLQTTFPEFNAFTVSFDIGTMLYLSQLIGRERRADMWIRDIQVGIVVRHIGTNFRWNNEKYVAKFFGDQRGSGRTERVPVEVAVGGSARFLERKLVFAADVLKNEKQSIKVHTGAEYFVTAEFALRVGQSAGQGTVGFGYMFKVGQSHLALAYAFSAERASEGSEHIFSFDFFF
ncbi:MAG: PorV/PorQ family protein [Candidatus Zixiibacteriota bacterium]